MENKYVDFEVIIDKEGSAVADVTAREKGANCAVIRGVMQRMGKITSDETTGPLCDPVTEQA